VGQKSLVPRNKRQRTKMTRNTKGLHSVLNDSYSVFVKFLWVAAHFCRS